MFHDKEVCHTPVDYDGPWTCTPLCQLEVDVALNCQQLKFDTHSTCGSILVVVLDQGLDTFGALQKVFTGSPF